VTVKDPVSDFMGKCKIQATFSAGFQQVLIGADQPLINVRGTQNTGNTKIILKINNFFA
jgi:hypothetical protein